MLDRYDVADLREALHFLDSGCDRDTWHMIGRAAIAAGLTVGEIDAWSATAENYCGTRSVNAAFRNITPDGGTGPGTLIWLAKAAGWESKPKPAKGATVRRSKALVRAVEPPNMPAPGMSPTEVWERSLPAPADHAYIAAKAGMPEGLRVVPDGDLLRIAGQSMAGALVVPAYGPQGLQSLQFIPPPRAGKKLNLPGAPMAGASFVVGELAPGAMAYIVEGIGAAWSCWKATGAAAVVCFGWSNVARVAANMRERDAGARLVLVPDTGKEEKADEIAREVDAAVARMPDGWPDNSDVNDLAQRDGVDVLEVLLSQAKTPAPGMQPFSLVPTDDLATTEPRPPEFVWDGLVPAGHVTLFAAHGGTGKSMLALMLAVAVALGLDLFGIPTRRGIVAFYSGEDGAALLRYRLRHVCRCMGVTVESLVGRLFVLDATDHDPTLFAEVTTNGRKEGATTATYATLRQFISEKAVSFLVVDNASDAFDASEIDRARVRGFMRALARVARELDAGVLLLAHVDKGTSRRERADTEAYSGSTAWNNSARSRLFMSRDDDGGLLLQHQKHNLGRLHEPLRLTWPDGGIPQAEQTFGPVVQGIADRGHEKALLRLIAEFTARGEYVTTATTSRTNAAKLLRHEPGFPRVKDGEVFNLLRTAERAGYLERITYKGPDRKDRERWATTQAGATFAGLPAATAATAATPEVTAPDAVPAEPAATAATSAPRGVGGSARTKEVA